MTNPRKQKYIERIRKETTYPFLRAIINVAMILMFVMAGGAVFIAFFGAVKEGGAPVLFGGLGAAVLLVIGGVVIKESAVVLLDIADSITDLNYRYEGQ